MASTPVSINLALNQPGKTIADSINGLLVRVDSLEVSITAIEDDVIAIENEQVVLGNRISSAESRITVLESQFNVIDAKLTDIINRVEAIESGTARNGPVVGTLVHLRGDLGECINALVYRFWNEVDDDATVDVVYSDPNRNSESKWLSRIDIRFENGTEPKPFTYWHWPETPSVRQIG